MIGGTKFYERAEIKDAFAYLGLLANPADQVAFGRIINSPRRGIGNTTRAAGRVANTTGLTIWEVIERVEDVPGMSAAAIKSVGRFFEMMDALRDRVEAWVHWILERDLTDRLHGSLAAERTVEAEGRVENLEALVKGAAEFDSEREVEGESEMSPLEEYLQSEHAALRAGRAGGGGERESHADDAPQREGAGVRHGLHHRLRGRRLPHMRRWRRAAKRRSGASVTSASPAPNAAST